ncbi:MAG TPA: hypothetical protein VFA17_10245 [Thermoplasmata archaeon]|nr:hypothetical protein [Thermoplasmata archaeon]
MSGDVKVGLESDLRDPLMTWLDDSGFEVRVEVPILWRRADLVGLKEGELIAVEMKLNQWREALCQATAYQVAADRAWVAMPLEAASRAYRERWIFEAQGVGLLAVDALGRVRTPIPARPSPRLLPFLRERVLEDLRSFSRLRELAGEGPESAILSRHPPATSLIP